MPIILSHTSAIEAWRIFRAENERPQASQSASKAIEQLPSTSLVSKPGISRRQAENLIACEIPALDQPAHILIPRECNLSGHANGVIPHRTTLSFPARSFRRISDSIYACAPELAFVQSATLTSLPQLISIGYELCGSYSPEVPSNSSMPLTTPRKLLSYSSRLSNADGAPAARKAARHVFRGSASPMETAVAMELSLPYSLGGKNFPTPLLNHEVKLTDSAAVIAGRRRLRYDLFWPEALLAVEYDSRQHHNNNAARIKDSQKRAASIDMGITIIGITEKQFLNMLEFDEISMMLARLLGHRVRPRSKDYRTKRFALRAQLRHLYSLDATRNCFPPKGD